jgi:hypothetical protein
MSIARVNTKDLSVLGSGDDDFLEPEFVAIEPRVMGDRGGDGGIRCSGKPLDKSNEVPRETLMR